MKTKDFERFMSWDALPLAININLSGKQASKQELTKYSVMLNEVIYDNINNAESYLNTKCPMVYKAIDIINTSYWKETIEEVHKKTFYDVFGVKLSHLSSLYNASIAFVFSYAIKNQKSLASVDIPIVSKSGALLESEYMEGEYINRLTAANGYIRPLMREISESYNNLSRKSAGYNLIDSNLYILDNVNDLSDSLNRMRQLYPHLKESVYGISREFCRVGAEELSRYLLGVYDIDIQYHRYETEPEYFAAEAVAWEFIFKFALKYKVDITAKRV